MTYVLPHLTSRQSKALQKHSGAQLPSSYAPHLCSSGFFRKAFAAAVKNYTLCKPSEKKRCSMLVAGMCQLELSDYAQNRMGQKDGRETIKSRKKMRELLQRCSSWLLQSCYLFIF